VFQTVETIRSKGTDWLASTPPILSAAHRQKLESGSKIDHAVIAERGYRTISPIEAITLGFTPKQVGHGGDCLLVPRWTVNGLQDGYQIRPDAPKPGRPKYESPRKQFNKIDTHPRCVEQLDDPRIELWVTEGASKVDSLVSLGLCAIGFAGVWSWRWTDPVTGGKVAVPCWELIALNGRTVIPVFDDDSMTKVSVAEALRRLSGFLISKGAQIGRFHWDAFNSLFGETPDAT
jgi:Domain of unknown function (DUF3854)